MLPTKHLSTLQATDGDHANHLCSLGWYARDTGM